LIWHDDRRSSPFCFGFDHAKLIIPAVGVRRETNAGGTELSTEGQALSRAVGPIALR
jgi:hypothetical protein